MAVREIGTDIKLTGEQEFNDGMKSINSNLKVLKSDMAAVSATFEDNANSVEALNAKNKVLKDIYDQQRVKVDALQQMYGKVAEKYGENSAQADKYKTQLNQATVAMVKAEKELRKNAEALDEATSSAKPAEKAAEDVADANKKVAKSSGDAAEKVTLLSKAGDKAKSVLGGIGSVAGVTAQVMGKMTVASAAALAGLAAAGAAGLTMMAEFAREAADAAREAKDAGQELSATQEAWLAYSDQLGALDASVSKAKGALSGVLLPILGDLSSEGTDFLNNFSQSMEEAADDTEKQGEVIAEYIVKAAQLIKQKLPEYIALGKELFAAIGEGLSDSDDELFEMAEDLVFDLLDGIIAFAPELGQAAISLIEKLMNGLIERGPDLVTSAVSMVSQLVSGLAQAAPDLIPAAGRLIGELLIALIHSAPQLLEAGLELVYGIVAGLIGGVGEILSAVDVLVEELITFFSESDSEFLQAGADILTAIKEGISRGWEALKTWFKNLWNSLFGDLDVEVGVSGTQNSPHGSRSLPELVTSATKNMTQDPQYPAWPNSPRGGSAGCGNVINLYFYAKTITQSDIDMVIDKVNEALGDEL